MPIAKETLRLGFTIVALPGGYVSQSAVDTYGWANMVDAGKDVEAGADDDRAAVAPSNGTPKAAKK
jgi:hypothetical protein